MGILISQKITDPMICVGEQLQKTFAHNACFKTSVLHRKFQKHPLSFFPPCMRTAPEPSMVYDTPS